MIACRLTLSLLAAAAAIPLGACGGEDTLSAEQFVDRANAEGAGMLLGEPLPASGPIEVFSVELAETGEEPRAAGSQDGHEDGAASLAITGDEEAGVVELERCEGALTITCYRVENVVLRVQSGEPRELERIESAIGALGGE